MIHFSTGNADTGPRVYLRDVADLRRFEVGSEYRLFRHQRPLSNARVRVVRILESTGALVIDDPECIWAEMRRGDELRKVGGNG